MKEHLEMNEDASIERMPVFLCHASDDKELVRVLYKRLLADGVSPWLDEQDLAPGQDWEREIRLAVRNAGVVLICLSNQALTKQGFVQKEIRFALDVAQKQPEGSTYIIPVRLEPCEMPESLKQWQRVDIFTESGYSRLLRAIQTRTVAWSSQHQPSKPIAVGDQQSREDPSVDVSSDTEANSVWDALATYAVAATYADARQLGGVLVRPLAEKLSSEQTGALINAVMSNTQLWQCVYGVHAPPRLLAAVFDATKQYWPRTKWAWKALTTFLQRVSSAFGGDDYRADYSALVALVESAESGDE